MMNSRKVGWFYCRSCSRTLRGREHKEVYKKGDSLRCVYCNSRVSICSSNFRTKELFDYPDSKPKVAIEVRKR